MNNILPQEQVLYKFDVENIKLNENKDYMPEYKAVYDKLKMCININEPGYNLYLIDDFSKEKLYNIINYTKEILKDRNKPRDICYVTYEDEKYPVPIYLHNGCGKKLKEQLLNVQDAYTDLIFQFYNGSTNEEKENLLDYIADRRSELLNELITNAKNQGFDIRSNDRGFVFIPLKDERIMTEEEYDELDQNVKEDILNKVSELKSRAKEILAKLKEIEEKEIDKIKKMMSEYLTHNISSYKEKYLQELEVSKDGIEYLDIICDKIHDELVDNYTSNYDEDEEKINDIIYKYKVNVLVDNCEADMPQVVYEEDPTINNLLGNMEYENHNGVYTTDVSLIKSGSMLRANEGCLIIKMSNLLNHPSSYYYLKKTILTEKIDYNYNKGYFELLSLSTLKPEPIKIREKVILIGDYETYNLLYNYDEDFRKIFNIRAESNPIVDIDEKIKQSLVKNIFTICKKNKFKPLTNTAIKEVAKYLSRKAESRYKLYFDNYEINNILTLTNNSIKKFNKRNIDAQDIIKMAYPEEIIEKEILDNYKDKKILITVKSNAIGKINGLSVIDAGYTRIGKPIRITCSCYKGEGNIVDVQKESNLSGNIHSKSINILKGFLNHLVGGYNSLSVDFHLSFEQIYSPINGDSASVAEAICMVSALSKIPIRQNIAVTGSINQFGEVQAIGGVNEKIEGFFKTCKLIDSIEGKGVLIPYSNKDDLILNEEVEKEVCNGKFKIYTMNSMFDAIEVLMEDGKYNVEAVLIEMKKEMKKYSTRKGK